MAPFILEAVKAIGEAVLTSAVKEASANPEKVAEAAVDAVGNVILAPLKAADSVLDFLNNL